MKLFTLTLSLLLLLGVSSCSDSESLSSNSPIELSTEELHGERSLTETENSVTDRISFTIVFNKKWDENSTEFIALLKVYELEKDPSFSIDGEMGAINLRPKSKLDSPVNVGKLLSLANNDILMVTVNGLNSSTAS